jgi:hypothetical protein
MGPGPESTGAPLGSLEFELTDELAFQAAVALFERQSQSVKEDIVRQGMPHPATPIVLASAMLLIAMVMAAIWAWESLLTRVLLILGCLVEVLLLFKVGLYFSPAFARWYIRRQTRWMGRRLSPRTIRWTFFDDRLETKSAAAQRTLRWTDLKTVDVLAEFWWLHWKSAPVMVPAAALSAELQALIRRKAIEAGASVRGEVPVHEPGSGKLPGG